MERKYSIGFFIATILLFAILGIAYRGSYNYAKEQHMMEEEMQHAQSISTEGQAFKENSFFLMEVNGYVAVYHSDRKTVYEYTDISVSELPELLQNEIKNGKYMENLEELYGFLENYSS